MFIPPFVLLYMLEIFCCKHINRTMEIQSALNNLHTVVNQGKSIPQHCKDISWEILGICQHFAGDRKAALYSFEQSLLEDSFHKITTATRQRIDDLHFSEWLYLKTNVFKNNAMFSFKRKKLFLNKTYSCICYLVLSLHSSSESILALFCYYIILSKEAFSFRLFHFWRCHA